MAAISAPATLFCGSIGLTCEKAMSLLHLGLVKVSLARATMPEAYEDMVKNCSSMNDIREVAGEPRKGKTAKKGATAKRTGGRTSAAAASAAPDAGAADEAEAEADEEAGE